MTCQQFNLYDNSDQVIRALLEVSALVNKNGSPKVLYKSIHQIVNQIIEVKNIAIALYDHSNQKITFDYVVDEKDESTFSGQTVQLGPGLTSYLIKSKQAQILTKQDILHLQNIGEIDSALGTISESWLGVPFIKNDTVYGVLILQSYVDTTLYTQEHLKFLTFVSGHITNVIVQKIFSLEQQAIKHELRKNIRVVKEQNNQLETMMLQLKQAQDELVQKEKMASLGNLVAGVAHEINTPLGICVTGISNLSHLYRNIQSKFDTKKLTSDQLTDFLEDLDDTCKIIEMNSIKAAELVNSFKRMAVDQDSLEVRIINVKDYIEETIHSLKPILKTTEHKVNIRGEDKLVVESTPGAVSQVITNLVQNSLIHAFSDNKTGLINIEVKSNPDSIILIYRDDGIGMTHEQLQHLFEPFYTTKRNQGGSGLGAHLIYNLVTTTLNGHISVDSQLGCGSEFTIKIPK